MQNLQMQNLGPNDMEQLNFTTKMIKRGTTLNERTMKNTAKWILTESIQSCAFWCATEKQ